MSANFSSSKDGARRSAAVLISFLMAALFVASAEALSYDFECPIVKYGSDGNLLWSSRLQQHGGCFGLVVDETGEVYVTSETALIKLDSAGNQIWALDYPEQISYGPIVLDGNNDIVLAGSPNTEYGLALAKYNLDGELLWSNIYAMDDPSWASDVLIDAENNIFIAGGIADSPEYLIVKFDSDGEWQWMNTTFANTSAFDSSFDIAAAEDPTGNIVFAGNTDGTASVPVVKLNSDGQQIWHSESANANWYDVAADADGNTFVAGTSDQKIQTVNFDNFGNEEWSVSWGEPGEYLSNEARSITVNSSGTIIVAGQYYDDGFHKKIIVLGYDQNGSIIWTTSLGGQASREVSAIALDPNENIVVAGNLLQDDGFSFRFLMFELDSTGEGQWSASYDDAANRNDTLTAMAVDQQGAVFLTGWSLGPVGDDDTIDDDVFGDDDSAPDDDSDDDTSPDDDSATPPTSDDDDDDDACGC